MPREAGSHVARMDHLMQIGFPRLAPRMQVNALWMIYKQRHRMATVHANIDCSWPRMTDLFAR